VNLVDENVPLDQVELLESWGFRCRVIGRDVAHLGVGDDNIVTSSHRLKNPTLLTRDKDFFQRRLCHRSYCIAWLDVALAESAFFARRFLRHTRFAKHSDRLGVVARIHHDGVSFWRYSVSAMLRVGWQAES